MTKIILKVTIITKTMMIILIIVSVTLCVVTLLLDNLEVAPTAQNMLTTNKN